MKVSFDIEHMKVSFGMYPNSTDTDGHWFADIFCNLLMFIFGIFFAFYY